jgi:hypothetical protein
MKIVPEPRLGLFVPENGGFAMKGAARPSSKVQLTKRIASIDLASYKLALKKTIEAAPSGLSQGVLQRVSVPQATFLTNAYRNSPVKVMVMGQETLGVNRRLADVDETVPNWFEDFYAASETDFDTFDFGFCMNWKRNPFWTAFQEVSDTFELPDRRAVAWSNISKVQLLDPVGNSASIINLNPAERMEIIR